jgi:ligand-binding SRPBCC domain-containing protein
MKIHSLSRQQDVAAPLCDVFAFFAKPENLTNITPPSMKFTILTPSPVLMEKGTMIDYMVTVFGIRRHWRSMITDYDPPHTFTDEQITGPYIFWHHSHRFEEIASGTRIFDDVRYVLPFGVLGRMAHRLLIHKQLDRIFNYRMRIIDELFSSSHNQEKSHLIRGS